MANYFLAACLFRIALPVLILTCALFRPSALSAVYLLLLLYSSMVPVPTTKSMAGHTGIYFKVLIVFSILGALLQVAFQIVLVVLSPYGHFLVHCHMPETILTYCGFVRLDKANGIVMTTWLAPEVVMTLSSLCIFTLCKKLTRHVEAGPEQGEVHPKAKPKRNYGFWISVAKYTGLISLCGAAVLRPSIPGAFYFLVFIGSCTWWACYKELERGFAIVCRVVMFVVFLHISCLYAYQFEWAQEKVNVSNRYIRYLGIEPLFNTSCEDPRMIYWRPIAWDSYLNPLALIWLFYILAMVSKHLLKPKIHRRRGYSVDERTPLMRGTSPSRKYGRRKSLGAAAVIQDSTGSVTVTSENQDDIPLENLEEEEEKPGCFENAVFIVESLIQFIIQSSYVVTNIIMMTWSITYHSWLTFVLLLWANILWMIPNQRRSTLQSSPVLVCYAIFLLISGYVYSMDIDELRSEIYGISLEQIGFKKIRTFPCNPLFIKCLFTVMFWITLRQHMKEIREARQINTLADMASPLQVTVSPATGVASDKATHDTQMLKSIGGYLKKFFSRFWIWIVAITLFAVAITGERMTAFRILYMALFLFFIITFQLSFRVWIKMMFGFWLTVIIYSMTILILVYTYQFNNFDTYWTEYLHVPKEQQLDIGLETYNPAQLFVRLATPTFFVIVTVIQLQYFHRDFVLISTPTVDPTIGLTSEEASSMQGKVLEQQDGKDDTDKSDLSSLKIDLTDIGNVSGKQLKHKMIAFWKRIYAVINLCFTFLEIYMHKFVLLVAMLMCIYDKCALYYAIVFFVVIGITTGRRMQMFVIYSSSIFTSFVLLARMVYQIQYIKHDIWNVSCPQANLSDNVTLNNADWLGFRKTVYGRDLPRLVQWNIAYVLAVTLYTVVLVRQFNYKVSKGKPTTRLFFMFPGITRREGDKNLRNALKYLCNYGYYKFGVEVSLMATVALIGFRMDVYALLYAIWLCILFGLNRRTLAKVWDFYVFFIVIFIPIQYVMIVGLPPSLCLEFPWNESRFLRQLQEWAFLMDYQYPPAAKKLVFDVILLIFVARQSVVFRIEKNYRDQEYPGGSNESIIHHAEDRDFVNPSPDFITFTRSYLDVAKRVILLGFMWLTLAIVFLAGANRVNIFSVGYLIGSFIFLWQGSDIYLRPIPKILKSWNILLGYNVFVILCKTGLQLVGCVFLGDISECWLVQLLGIGCVRKFAVVPKDLPEDMCEVPRDYIGLVWDGICFGFLIMMRRIFCSYNFFHMIDETKATTILASRGAELIEQLRLKRMRDQDEQERRILEKIKAKMDRIKATQQKMQGPFTSTTNHYVDQPPLARTSSVSSCASAASEQTPEAGYHTPIDEDEPAPLTPAAGSLIQPQAPSPFSAIMTVSLEGYLEPQRMSFSSPPNSELNPRPPSPDDSYPVFSPPPYDAAPPYAEVVNIPPVPPQRQPSIGPPWMNGALTTPRQSIISYSSRSPLSHHTYGLYPKSRPLYKKWQPKTYKQAIRSGDYYMFDELEDDDDLEMIEELRPEDEDDIDDEDEQTKMKMAKKRTLGQLLSDAIKSDLGTTVRRSDKEDRRSSMPLTRQRSTLSGRSSGPMSAPPIIEESSPRRSDRPSSTKRKARLTDIEPRPGTSKDDDELSDISEPGDSKCQTVLNIFLFIWAFIDSTLVSLTNFLNKYSRDYRYVVKVLGKEKKLLKQTSEYTRGTRTGRGQRWQPAGSYHTLLHISQAASMLDLTPTIGTNSPSGSYRLTLLRAIEATTRNDNSADNSNNTTAASDKPTAPDSDSYGSKAQEAGGSPLPYSPEKDRRKASVLTVPEIRILAPSLERGLDSPSLLRCSSDPAMIIHRKFDEYDAGELSSYDQPTIIRFALSLWYIILNHSDILCYFVIFLNQIKSATLLSLPLPLLVFLWGTLTVPRPSKNFWVTIIAYTQLIVLIKCMFQFEFLPWNRDAYYYVNPMNPARIFGVERKINYAIWDLLLLLIVFFHRYLMKCMGLWRTTVMVAPVFEDGEHMIDEDEINPLKRMDKTANPFEDGGVPESTGPISMVSAVAQRDSDLQRLVEENEENPEEELPQEYMGIDNVVNVTVKETTPYEMFPDTLHMTTSKYFETVKDFFTQLKDPTSRVAVDVYSYMFMCDFFNFFVILIGYSSFGTQQGDGGVSSYLEDNRVPTLFLIMLILQFMLILVDRAIFLRKHIVAKIVFQFVQIFVLHIWLFVLFPAMTERNFNSVVPPQMYYMVKCFYLLLSAYQIRCGYPSRILGNFLCKGYNYLNMFLFKAFMLIPFLFELRTVMDWMWTDTSMTIFDWIKMEDIFAHIFQLKCTRHVENEYPQPRGERKSPMVKYFMGAFILFIIVAIIWFPLVFFSLGNAVGEPNPPYDVTLDLRIGPYEPVYHLSAQSNAIYQFSQTDVKDLLITYKTNKVATAFISNYEPPDIVAVKLSRDSANIWSISPPDRLRMIQEVNSSNPISIRLQYIISHGSHNKEVSGVIREENVVIMAHEVDGKPNAERQKLLEMLSGSDTVPAIRLDYILPKFLKVTNRGTAKPVSQMMKVEGGDVRTEELRQLDLILRKSPENDELEWWEVGEICDDDNYIDILSKLPYADCDSVMLYAFNDRIFPETLNIITAGGIIGLYTTLVFVASRLLRGFFAEICFKIMFEDMPNVDRVLQLCHDIYLVREAREFCLEEDLFAKLVFLFRSPETLIKWTRPKEELADDEDPEGEPE